MKSLRARWDAYWAPAPRTPAGAHWWAQRVSAVALVPLSLWFLFSLLLLPDLGYLTMRAWLAVPCRACSPWRWSRCSRITPSSVSSVVVEDYVHAAGLRTLLLLALSSAFVSSAGARCSRSCASRSGRRSMSDYKFIDHTYDVVVVGAGGAGLRATFGLAEAGLTTACITKVFPTRSHTVAAQGGISAALGNMGDGRLALAHVRHRQGVGLARRPGRDRVHVQRGARRRSSSWSTTACRSRRTADGTIYQRPFGGMTTHYGKGIAQRTCAAADRTGHAMLHTLYQQSLQARRRVLHRVFRARPDHGRGGECRGVIAWNLATARCTASARTRWSWRPAATAAPISPAPRPTPAPATAAAWCCAPACRCRTWSSCSSTRPASTARAA